ncbi:asparagine synthase-related protein [Kibdelosporangium persicum]|uniref:Lasso peptide isopeptide bond-forming cyclase n=1 Tax=Kibdelosporangium persicum TaxID=2698649 RepID=A0ABX2FFL3_9PSEU|nr:asparagine synthase-related protein [Kibdelosporangium persicum]NRN70165.1 Lasso peptide isopeptide bond-forming cyclase [Kibdelosporangium persicum]
MEFVVLPDHPAADEVYARLPERYRENTLYHHSGRPWLAGRWPAGVVIGAQTGASRIALLGCARTTEPELAAQLGKVSDLRQFDRLVERTAGCFHLVAAIDGVVRVQGSLSGARQLFATSVHGIRVVANRVSPLRELRRLTLAEEHVAMHLLCYVPPWPLNERSVWREIDCVPFGHYLCLRPDGTAEPVRWWSPPEPDIPIEQAAHRFREALVAAVAARTGTAPVVGADLSGGMDSTSLCFIAAGQGGRLVTVRRKPMDPTNPDEAFASRAETALPDAEHVVLDRDTAVLYYDSLDRDDLEVDEPPPFIAMRAYVDDVARLVAARGATSHIQGHGSDELAATGTTYVNALAQQNPIRSLRSIRAIRAMRRWSLTTTLRVVRPFPPYAEWLHRSADGLLSPPDFESQVGWEPDPHLPAWASRQAAELVRDTLCGCAVTNPQPLSPVPFQHDTLRSILVNGSIVRFANTLGARSGVSFEAPFLDDQVVRAALSVRLADRHVVGRTKPLLAAAMRGIVPEYILDRTTKGHFTVDTYAGRKRHLDRMRQMCEESHLVAMGLVDPAGFRRVLSGIMPDPANIGPLENTLACEAWLRSLPAETGLRLR